MTRRTMIAAGLVAALAGGSATVFAQGPTRFGPPGPGGPRGPHGGSRIDPGLFGVELTDAQREQVRAIHEAHRAALDEAARALHEAHRALAEAAQQTPVDEAAIKARSGPLAAALAQEALVRARVRAEVHGILTAEQLQQIAERQAERQRRMQERQQRMDDRRDQKRERRPGQ